MCIVLEYLLEVGEFNIILIEVVFCFMNEGGNVVYVFVVCEFVDWKILGN